MRLNLDILAAWLPEQWRIKQFGSGLRELTLARPRLYEPGVAIQADTLYLTRAEMLPAAPPEVSCSFVCIGRKIPKPYLTAGLPILQLPDAVSLTEVYNRVQEIYDKFDTWDSHLRDELEKDVDFDIRQLLLLASGFLRRGVNVVDSNLQRLFSADFDPQTGASIIDQHGPMPMEHNERIKEVCTLERVIREPYQTALDFDGRAYCKNLYVSDQFCGCIFCQRVWSPFSGVGVPGHGTLLLLFPARVFHLPARLRQTGKRRAFCAAQGTRRKSADRRRAAGTGLIRRKHGCCLSCAHTKMNRHSLWIICTRP